MHFEDRTDLGGGQLARPLGLCVLIVMLVSVGLMGFASNPHLRSVGALFEGLCIGILTGPSLAIWAHDGVKKAVAGSAPASPPSRGSEADFSTHDVVNYVVDFISAIGDTKLTPMQHFLVAQVVHDLPDDANMETFLRACQPDALRRTGVAPEHAALLAPFVKQLEDRWDVLSNTGFFRRAGTSLEN